MHYDQLGNIVEEEGEHEVLEIHQLVSEVIDSQQQENADLRAALDSASERLAFYREADTTFQATLADAASRAAEIKSKAQAQTEALLRYTRHERAQLEAVVESLQQHNRLARELHHTLSNLEQLLQAMAEALRQTEEQVEQQMQSFHETATQLEDLREAVAEGYPKPEEEKKKEEEAIEEYEAPGAQQSVSRTWENLKETVVEEHPKLAEKAIEECEAPEAPQSVSRTWVRIIGLRQIARLHHIERTLVAHSAVEEVKIVQYTGGDLVLRVGHRSAPLLDIFKELPGVQVQEVLRTEDGWIEVRLDSTDANSRAEG